MDQVQKRNRYRYLYLTVPYPYGTVRYRTVRYRTVSHFSKLFQIKDGSNYTKLFQIHIYIRITDGFGANETRGRTGRGPLHRKGEEEGWQRRMEEACSEGQFNSRV